ncbi:hypothetical protein N0V93_008105 [Gnomoniopsis smithogilvyi]|uniref:Uncharacterized protein n=1 Tax=Gnomoniopsis smithogilvyi TaxID=1191159 RepID=A0A9W9CUG1_9PEZI|nr:hypothetical protein N0V93_008105 [Gnomoniopsis smithogilvyi]
MLPRVGGILFLASCATADLASIQGALDAVNAGLLKLDKAVVGLPSTVNFLTTLGAAAVPVLVNATQIIQQSAPLNLEEAASLATSTAALRQNSNLTITDLLAQRGFFVALNQTSVITDGLAGDKAASIALGDALFSKVPDAAQGPARQAIQEIFDIYDHGLALFTNLSLDTGVPPAPAVTSTPNPSDFTPIFLPVPQAAVVESGKGSLNADGSCNCAVQCPAGSLGMNAMMEMAGVTGTMGVSGAPALKMLPGAPSRSTS